MAHGTTVTEASSENLLLINAEVLLGKSKHLISEGDVLTTLVSPASVKTVGGDEDGRVASQVAKAIVTALDDVAHISAAPVVAEDETVGLIVLVVVGQLEGVLAVLAVDLQGLDTAGGRLLATAS